MCKMLLSINPEHIENIFKGTKKFEFRKVVCSRNVDTIVFYATYPIKKIVGEASVVDILVDSPDIIWGLTNKYAGISKTFFEDYYFQKDKAVAFQIDSVLKYKYPKNLKDLGILKAPQSFQYL